MAFETWAEQRDRHLARIADLETALRRINALNDSPAQFNSEIQDVLNSVIDTAGMLYLSNPGGRASVC